MAFCGRRIASIRLVFLFDKALLKRELPLGSLEDFWLGSGKIISLKQKIWCIESLVHLLAIVDVVLIENGLFLSYVFRADKDRERVWLALQSRLSNAVSILRVIDEVSLSLVLGESILLFTLFRTLPAVVVRTVRQALR